MLRSFSAIALVPGTGTAALRLIWKNSSAIEENVEEKEDEAEKVPYSTPLTVIVPTELREYVRLYSVLCLYVLYVRVKVELLEGL